MAIDDEPLALKHVNDYINKTPFLELVSSCTNAFSAMEYLQDNKVDLIFTDINMPDLSGLDFIRSLEEKPILIFTTAYSQYAIEGFKVDALDYLLKPFDYQDFLTSANKALKQFQLQKKAMESTTETLKKGDEHIFIKSEYKIVRIKIDNIKYIEGMREYIRINLVNGKPIMALLSLKTMENEMPEDKFMRVHKSYIVNLDQIETIERFRIIFDEDVRIPVGEQYKDKFKEYIDKKFIL